MKRKIEPQPTLKDEIFRLYAEGKSYSAISRELGCSKGTISYHLGAGQKEKAINRRKQSRHKNIAFVRNAKQGKKCVDCREDYPYWILEFDHLPGHEKLFTIGGRNSRDYSIEQLTAEMAKCEIVCSNCHKDRTYRRQLKNGEYDGISEYYE